MNNCLNINNIDYFLYSLNEIIFEKCFVDIIHSVVVADVSVSAILYCCPFLALISLRGIKMKHYGFRK